MQNFEISNKKPTEIDSDFTTDREATVTDRESPIDDSEVAAVIARMSVDGRDQRDIAHALISGGLCHLAAKLCDLHLIEELEFVQGWIGERLAELRDGLKN
jgi:hypothetical protein